MVKPIRYQDKPWLSHYEQGVPEHIDYIDILLPQMLEQSASRFPDKPALLFEGYSVSFRQLNDMVNRFACCLHQFGIQKGDRVAIYMKN